MLNFVKSLGLLALLAGGFYLYTLYDKAANYVPIEARVTNVEALCQLVKKSRRRREYTDPMPCDLARAAATQPKFEGFKVEEQTYVSYAYTVDGKEYASKHRQAAQSDGRKIGVGDELTVLVSKDNPTTTRAK